MCDHRIPPVTLLCAVTGVVVATLLSAVTVALPVAFLCLVTCVLSVTLLSPFFARGQYGLAVTSL